MSRQDQRLIVGAAISVMVARAALRCMRFRRAEGVVNRFVPLVARALAPPAQVAVDPARIAWAVERVGRELPACTCLVRALAARAMLLARGETSELRFGVAAAPSEPAMAAHAWLEHEGRVLVGRDERLRYGALARPDAHPYFS